VAGRILRNSLALALEVVVSPTTVAIIAGSVCALCCKTRRMSDSNVVIRKKRGRPRIGQAPVVSFRLGLEWQQDIDEWRSGEPGHPSRSDAIRCLIGMGLSAAYDERKQAGR